MTLPAITQADREAALAALTITENEMEDPQICEAILRTIHAHIPYLNNHAIFDQICQDILTSVAGIHRASLASGVNYLEAIISTFERAATQPQAPARFRNTALALRAWVPPAPQIPVVNPIVGGAHGAAAGAVAGLPSLYGQTVAAADLPQMVANIQPRMIPNIVVPNNYVLAGYAHYGRASAPVVVATALRPTAGDSRRYYLFNTTIQPFQNDWAADDTYLKGHVMASILADYLPKIAASDNEETVLRLTGELFAIALPNSVRADATTSNAMILRAAKSRQLNPTERAYYIQHHPGNTPAWVNDSNSLVEGDINAYLTTILGAGYASIKGGFRTTMIEFLLAVARQGSVTNTTINRVQREVSADINYTLTIDKDHISWIWRNFGSFIDSDAAGRVFRDYERTAGAISMRLQLILSRAVWNSLTCLQWIREALLAYPDFDWPRVQLLCTSQFSAFREADRLVGNNAFYGYGRDLGPVASSHYRSIAYVAKELKKQVDGQLDVDNYGGLGGGAIPRIAELNQLIQAYVNRPQGQLDPTIQYQAAIAVHEAQVQVQGHIGGVVPAAPIAPAP